jgi:hypothetical protein
MKQIAFLASPNYDSTLKKCPDFIDEFALLRHSFHEQKAKLIRVDWRDETVDWNQYERVIPKACWDYSEHPLDFFNYLQRMQTQKIVFRNPIETIIWNMRKTYLVEMLAKGFSVGELKIIPENTQLDESHFLSLGSQTVVAKPSISGGARNTIRCKASELPSHLPLLQTILKSSDLILQPFFPEISVDGEYSFFFFGGEYSHAILKKPAQGDFRAHQLFGAQNLSYEPKPSEILQAKKFIEAAPNDCAYARVDLFRRKDIFFLIELELLEPYLYFERAPEESVESFCRAILS